MLDLRSQRNLTEDYCYHVAQPSVCQSIYYMINVVVHLFPFTGMSTFTGCNYKTFLTSQLTYFLPYFPFRISI